MDENMQYMVIRLPRQPAAVRGQFNVHVSLTSLQLSVK